MRSEVDTRGGMRGSRWPRSVVMWITLTTVVVIAWGSSHCFMSVIDARDSLARPDEPHGERVEATGIQFIIDALHSPQASLDQPDLNRALSFVARFQPQRTLSE